MASFALFRILVIFSIRCPHKSESCIVFFNLPAQSPIAFPNSFILEIAFDINPTTPSIAFPNTLVSFMLFRKLNSQSPRDAVVSKMLPPRPLKFPNNLTIPPANSFIKVHPISITENNPLKVDFNFSDVVSLILILDVKSLMASVILRSCCAVVGGNISRNASLIGAMIDAIPSHAFQKDSMRASRPPRSFHS